MLAALPHMNLFTHRELMTWIDQPFTVPSVSRIKSRGHLPDSGYLGLHGVSRYF